ncbi:MAG: hypothetical protein ACJAQT_004132 [Akkermansiaceae bacterium]|jgi:hypothetical protein
MTTLMKTLFLTIALWGFLLVPSFAVERTHLAPGFYSGDNHGWKKMDEMLNGADVQIGLSWHAGVSVGEKSKLTMLELEEILKKRKGRKTAGISLAKNYTDETLDQKVKELLIKLGFKEVLIVGAHSRGAYLYSHWNEAWQDLPELFIESNFDSESLTKAVNHYIGLGEEKAVAELQQLAGRYVASPESGFDSNERIGWLCRILFQGKEGVRLRAPRFGGLSLPYLSMPKERWPLYPVAESNGVYFVLSQGYILRGRAEPAESYLDYGRKTGVFRKEEIRLPTAKGGTSAFQALMASDRWKAIKWKDSGPGTSFTMREDWVKLEIGLQVPLIQEVKAGSDEPKGQK